MESSRLEAMLRSAYPALLSSDFEVLRGGGGTVQEDLELVFSGWPSIRLRDVELRSGGTGRRDGLRGFAHDLSILVGPTGLQHRRCRAAFGPDRRIDSIVWLE